MKPLDSAANKPNQISTTSTNTAIQQSKLKGSGRTTYSGRGDGNATVSSVLREYIYSYVMQNLGIKTSRSLVVIETGESVRRRRIEPGAILVRVMKSHIRYGTF
ncbi:protein adenylyltransferase SelO family protein [Halorubrum sp. BOL3-1]|uniref:protein adenylyltransferase SelO family protein n=1 Tax=Halorubrum sp. BOL3-1 TaxID=2497325 RepID=UPI0021063370|nr:protein adenylyltransferase SelO family protein [Halorubrum sp. BOL3-1]